MLPPSAGVAVAVTVCFCTGISLPGLYVTVTSTSSVTAETTSSLGLVGWTGIGWPSPVFMVTVSTT